jgi:hypothetical protein
MQLFRHVQPFRLSPPLVRLGVLVGLGLALVAGCSGEAEREAPAATAEASSETAEATSRTAPDEGALGGMRRITDILVSCQDLCTAIRRDCDRAFGAIGCMDECRARYEGIGATAEECIVATRAYYHECAREVEDCDERQRILERESGHACDAELAAMARACD